MKLLAMLITYLPTLIYYSLIAYFALNLFTRFLLPFFLPFSGSIGHISPSSLHNLSIEWNRVKLTVGRIGISTRTGGKAWFVVYGDGIKVNVPRGTLLDLIAPLHPRHHKKQKKKHNHVPPPPPKPHSVEEKPHPPPPPKPAFLPRLFLPFIIRRVLSFVSAHFEFTIVLEGIGSIEGTVRMGGHYEKPHLRVPIVGVPIKHEDRVTLWTSVEDVKFVEGGGGIEKEEGKKKMLAAVELRERITFKVSAPIGLEEWKSLRPRIGSVRACVECEADGSAADLSAKEKVRGVVVRVHELKRLLGNFEALQCEAKSRRQASSSSEEAAPPPKSPPKPRHHPSPLVYFDSFSVSLPTLIFSLHYTTPLSILASSSPSVNQTLPETITFALIVSGVKGKLKLKGKTGGEKGCTKESHTAFLGKDVDCEIVGSIGWNEVEGRIDVDGKQEEIPGPAAKTLSIGPTEVSLTSTFDPFFASKPPPARPTSPHTGRPRAVLPKAKNYNDSTVLAEVHIGEIRGQTTYETLDAALRIFNARPRTPKPSHPLSTSHTTPSPSRRKLRQNVPRFVSSVSIASLELRIVAPPPQPSAVHRAQHVPPPASFYPRGQGQHPPYAGHHPFGRSSTVPSASTKTTNVTEDILSMEDEDGLEPPAEPHDSFFLPWSSPEILCIEVPRIVFTSSGEWVDRSVRRKAGDRLKVKRMERQSNAEAVRKNEREAARRNGTIRGDRSRNDQARGEGDEEEERSRTYEDEEEREFSRFPGRGDRHSPNGESSRAAKEPEHKTRQGNEERSRARHPKLPNLTPDLETYSLEYFVRSLVLVDTISVQILAVEKPTSDDNNSPSNDIANSELIRLEIASIGPVELDSKLVYLGYDSIDEERYTYVASLDPKTCRGDHSFLLQTVRLELWRPIVLSCIHDILNSFASAAATSSRQKERAASACSTPDSTPATAESAPRPLVELLPANQAVYFAVASTHFRFGGVDPKPSVRACRGLTVRTGSVFAEYLLQEAYEPEQATNDVNRSRLDLREDFRSNANAMATAGGQGGKDDVRQALCNVSVLHLFVDPLVEATEHERDEQSKRGKAAARRRTRDATSEKKIDHELIGRAEADKRGKDKPRATQDQDDAKRHQESIAWIPRLDLSLRIHKAAYNEQAADPGESLDEIIIRLDVPKTTLRLDLFSIYLCLLTVSSLRWLRPTVHLSTSSESTSTDSRKKRPRPLINFSTTIKALHVFPTLPHETILFLHLRKIVLRFTHPVGFQARWDTGILAGKSRVHRGKWEDIVRLQPSSVLIRDQANNKGHQPFVVDFKSEAIRLRIPYRYVFSQVVDNAVSLVKATKQLVHEHIKGRWDTIIEPTAEEAKRLPEINLDIGTFAIEFQDDPLESKLNMIWRFGYEEQKRRLALEQAFEKKAEAVRKEDERRRSGLDDDGDFEGDGSEGKGKETKSAGLDGRHTVEVDEAREILGGYNSTDWVKLIKRAKVEQDLREQALSKLLYGAKHLASVRDLGLPIDLLPVGSAAPLGRATFNTLRLSITKASFGDGGVRDYLFDVGKGLPRDTTFSLLVPIHLSWRFNEARFAIRDHPLPILHIPRNHHGSEPAWDCQADFVVAEELGGPESVRRVNCTVIPPRFYAGGRKGFNMTVPRSAMPVKTYTAPKIRIRSGEPTRIGWGNSVQPAIQDIARGIEAMTKNSPDPSDRIGFWDKIRLQLHWRVAIDFVGDKAAVVFHLKGSRDPHSLSGYGAGFAKAWAGNVKFRIGFDNPDHEFFQIISHSYVLGIPNLREYIDTTATGRPSADYEGGDELENQAEYDSDDVISEDMSAFEEPELESAYWIKVCAKCVGGVRWGMGLRFERTCSDDTCDSEACRARPTFERRCRIFDFIPHWDVHTKTRKTAPRTADGRLVDSFSRFRSDHLHFSISLTSPATLTLPGRDSCEDGEQQGEKPSVEAVGDQGRNSFHFTPQAKAHFDRWWSLFDGTMSLPIRQGRVFPSTGERSKKFGKHCATIKYRFSLAPLYISHTYAQESWAEWRRGETSAVGIKAKIGRFNVDLHQREQESISRRSEEMEPKIVRHKAFYMAEVDLDSVDLRVVDALFKEPEKGDIPIPEEDEDEAEIDPIPTTEYGVLPEDVDWIDLNDFNDAGHIFEDKHPQIRILPFLSCPRFVYYRHIEAAPVQDTEDGPRSNDQPNVAARPTTKFGSEPSHTCLMRRSTDTVLVQIREAGIRLVELQSQLSSSTDKAQQSNLRDRIAVVETMIARLRTLRIADHKNRFDEEARPCDDDSETSSSEDEDDDNLDLHGLKESVYRDWKDWQNRYVVHNPKIQISNARRDLLLKYYYSSRDRKAFVYHVSAAAIKFIRDLESKEKSRSRPSAHSRAKSASGVKKDYEEAEEAKNRLLNDLANGLANGFADSATPQGSPHARSVDTDRLDLDPSHSADNLPDVFESNARHLCMFIGPQISLHSDIDPESTILFSALRVVFKTYQVVDTRVPDDPINYEVLNQTYATLDGLQAFYPANQSRAVRDDREALFVPLEIRLQPDLDPYSFERVVQPTSASFRYDKVNQLRIHSKGGSFGNSDDNFKGFNSHTDRIYAEGDKFSVAATSAVYVAIFNVVFRLVLYSDPQRQRRNAKVSALAFTHDFSDRQGVIRSVEERQNQIRSLIPEILEYQLHLDEIDPIERRNLFGLRAELAHLVDEISLFIEGLSLAQHTNGTKTASKRTGVELQGRSSALTWTMLHPDKKPLVKASVVDIDFTWISKDDGSTTNRLLIGDLQALNPAPDALFAEIIQKLPASPTDPFSRSGLFAAAGWDGLAPVGGIGVIERFELHLHPIAVQIEHHVGRQMLDYLFTERIKSRKDDSSSNADRGRQSPKKLQSSQSSLASGSSYANSNRSVDSFNTGSRRSSEQQGSPSSSRPSLAPSNASIHSTDGRIRKAPSQQVLASGSQEEGLDAEEMQRRASLYRTFLSIDVPETRLRLTYRSEDETSLPNVYNLTCLTPAIRFHSKTTSFGGLFDDVKSELVKSLWHQKGKLLSQLLSRAHRRLPMAEQRAAVGQKVKSTLRNRLRIPKRGHSDVPSSTSQSSHLSTSPLRLTHSSSSSTSSSFDEAPDNRDERARSAEDVALGDQDLVRLLDPSVKLSTLSTEPDQEHELEPTLPRSRTTSRTDSSTSVSFQQNPIASGSNVTTHASQERPRHSRSLSSSHSHRSTQSHDSSKRPPLEHLGFPYHHSLHDPLAMSEHDKKKMLLGSSAG